jgi:hypothetical protein
MSLFTFRSYFLTFDTTLKRMEDERYGRRGREIRRCEERGGGGWSEEREEEEKEKENERKAH